MRFHGLDADRRKVNLRIADPKRVGLHVAVICFVLAAGLWPLQGQQGASPEGEWRAYGGDLGNTKYSPLTQIDADNFGKLQLAVALAVGRRVHQPHPAGRRRSVGQLGRHLRRSSIRKIPSAGAIGRRRSSRTSRPRR